MASRTEFLTVPDTVRVAAEIGQHLLRSTEGRLGVDYPLDPAELGEPPGEDGRRRKIGEIAEEAQLAGLERGLEILQEQPAEEPGKHTDRQEETRSAGDPACPPGSEPGAG